ncbi:unnamed protein product, partial [Rotaria sp. Silwood2]
MSFSTEPDKIKLDAILIHKLSLMETTNTDSCLYFL